MYINCVVDEWWSTDKGKATLNEGSLKSYIVKDLINMGIDITKLNFYIKIYGIQKINVRLYYRNEYTKEVMTEYTKAQLARKTKLDSLDLF